LSRFQQNKWLRREPDSRVVHISSKGETELTALFPV
jgi:hypothetical protein